MDFKQLESFVAVVRYGSFTKAAESLFLSQPTVSAHIRSLENDLGKRLIIRTTKNIEVTPKGLQVYKYAQRILELKGRMVQECGAAAQQIIHLGASTIPSAYILPEILSEFGRYHPDTYFIIHQSDSEGVQAGLLDGIYDIGLLSTPDEGRLRCIPFCRNAMVLITPVNEFFLALQKEPRPPLQTLMEQPIILREEGTRKNLSQLLEAMDISESQLNVTARSNDPETIKNLVACGLGVSIISELAAQNMVEEKRLLAFPIPDAREQTLYLAYRKEYILQPHIRDFTRFLLQRHQP